MVSFAILELLTGSDFTVEKFLLQLFCKMSNVYNKFFFPTSASETYAISSDFRRSIKDFFFLIIILRILFHFIQSDVAL